MRVCAITKVYNEAFNLPLWLSHYARQVEHRIVLDHGSDDGSTRNLMGAERITLPRDAEFSQIKRTTLVTNLTNGLLGYYDAVIYTDCDEMLIADPRKYASLTDYAERMQHHTYAIGLNIRQDTNTEPEIDPTRPILTQRSFVQFVSPMCKLLLIREPVSWGGGFHASNFPVRFDDVYLFHLRYMDRVQSLKRLAITRSIKRAPTNPGTHQKLSDDDHIKTAYANVSRMRLEEDFDFSKQLALCLERAVLSRAQHWLIKPAVYSRERFRIPKAFQEVF